MCPTTKVIDTIFLYYLFKSSDFKSYALGMSNGTTVIHLSKKTIPEYKFSIPNLHRVAEFSLIVKSMVTKINENHTQILYLKRIKDTLLPKLMSGEVRVEY